MTTEELKEKLALEEENRNRKIKALKDLDTKPLIDQLIDLEDKLEAALREEASYKNLNSGFLSSGTSDCAEVKRMIAVLTVQGPTGPTFPDGKVKNTAAERDAWLVLQRTENEELHAAINRQWGVAFELDNCRIAIDMAKKRLENVHKVLSLRTAQIQFLTETHN